MPGDFDLYMTMLFTDQGMGHLLTVTNANTDQIVSNSLFDFGSKKYRWCGETIDFVYNIITNKGKSTGNLDIVTVSHKDGDHWTLFKVLLEEFKEEDNTLNIKRLYWGGAEDSYRSFNFDDKHDTILNFLWECVSPKYTGKGDYPEKTSAFFGTTPLPALLQAGAGNQLRVLPFAVNATTTRTDASTLNNTPSLAISILYRVSPTVVRSILLPGDATAETLMFMNGILALPAAAEVKNAIMLSLPHHGALHSIADNYTTNNPDLTTATKFASLVKAQTIGASAGFNTYHHPQREVIQTFFVPELATLPAYHDFVWYDPSVNTWRTENTNRGVFTNFTVYSDDVSKRVEKRILFKIDSAGTCTTAVLEPNSAGIATAFRRSFIALPAAGDSG